MRMYMTLLLFSHVNFLSDESFAALPKILEEAIETWESRRNGISYSIARILKRKSGLP